MAYFPVTSDVHNKKINGCDSFCHSRKGMPTNFGPNEGDIIFKVLFVGKTKELYLCTNIHNHPTSGHYVEKYKNMMMEAVRTSETSVDNHFTRQYNPEDSSEHHTKTLFFHEVELTFLKAFMW
jgi:hypothetical protein